MKTLSYRPLEEGGTPHFITITHTHAHVFVDAELLTTSLTLFDPTHLQNPSSVSQRHPRSYISIQ